LASTVYKALFPLELNPFSPYLTKKNTLIGDVHEIEACLLANYQTMRNEISSRQSSLNLTIGLSTTDAELKKRLNNLIHYSTSAINTMIPNAESLMFGYKLWEVDNTLMNGEKPNDDDVKWLKTHWNFLNNCNKYNLNTAAVNLTVWGIIGLGFVATVAIAILASIFLAPAIAMIVANAAALALIAMEAIAMLSVLYMANTLLLRQENQQKSFFTKLKTPVFQNNGDKHSHACIVPGAASALSFFAPTTAQRFNKAAVDELDNVLIAQSST